MIQFYLLAVCLNIAGGLILSADFFSEKIPFAATLRDSVQEKQSWRIIFIVLLLFTGVFKVLSVTKGDVPVVGDLLPALSLLLIGISSLSGFFAEKSDTEGTFFHRMNAVLTPNNHIIGVSALVLGLLHFLFPSVLFL